MDRKARIVIENKFLLFILVGIRLHTVLSRDFAFNVKLLENLGCVFMSLITILFV
jgi:hypothetical protein